VGEYDSVKWEVGTRLNSSTKTSFSLYFNVLENRIPVKFTGYNARGSSCFPGTPTVQTITKHLTIVPETSTALLGSYFGYNTDNPKDTFTVKIQLNASGIGFIKNLPKDCLGYENNTFGYWDYQFGLANLAYGYNGLRQRKAYEPKCGQIDSKGFLVSRDTLIINYIHWKSISRFELDVPQSKCFKGVRRR
jgi:hypothetical protein